MKLKATIPTTQILLSGNVGSQYIRMQLFAADANGDPTGPVLAQQDVVSGDPSPLTGYMNNIQSAITQSGKYALVQFSIDSASNEISGTRQVTTFQVSAVTAPAGGTTVALAP